MKFRTNRDILKGEIIVQGGINGSNADTLINTGIINLPVPNLFDMALLEITLDPNDPLFNLKLELIDQSTNKFRYPLKDRFDTQGSWEIFSFLRYATYDEDPGFLLLARNQVHELKKNQFL